MGQLLRGVDLAKIELTNVSYVEDDLILLNNITVSIDQGELFMIRGSSLKEGRALIHIIHHLIKPIEGTVRLVFEEDEQEWIGSNCIPMISEFTVEEVLTLPLVSKGYTKKEVRSRIDEVASYFSIDALLKKRVSELTDAELSLVGVSKAVIAEPSLIILDSFSKALDHKVAVLVMTYLHEISVDYQVTVVMLENDTRLHPFAGKILHLEKGYIKDLVGEGVDLQKLMPFLKI